MKEEYSKFLEKVALDAGLDPAMTKQAFGNPLENSMFANSLDAGLKALELVAMGSLDLKLVGIVKLFQAYIAEKKRELEKSNYETQYGHGSYDSGSGSTNIDTNPYGNGSYY